MTKHEYKTSGTCSRRITFELDDEKKVHNVTFEGGCHGNLQGISKLVEGMDAEELINRVSGIKCGFKATSCPDQLSKAVIEAIK